MINSSRNFSGSINSTGNFSIVLKDQKNQQWEIRDICSGVHLDWPDPFIKADATQLKIKFITIKPNVLTTARAPFLKDRSITTSITL